MDLWIRSQDRKKIIKVDEIKIETVKEGNTFIYSHATDLGTYETKERALEVLNEIEERIMLINTISLARDMDTLIAYKNAVGEERINGLGYPYPMPLE